MTKYLDSFKRINKKLSEELEEISTSDAAGPYDTPNAFGELDTDSIEMLGYKKVQKKKKPVTESSFLRLGKELFLTDNKAYKKTLKENFETDLYKKYAKSILDLLNKEYYPKRGSEHWDEADERRIFHQIVLILEEVVTKYNISAPKLEGFQGGNDIDSMSGFRGGKHIYSPIELKKDLTDTMKNSWLKSLPPAAQSPKLFKKLIDSVLPELIKVFEKHIK